MQMNEQIIKTIDKLNSNEFPTEDRLEELLLRSGKEEDAYLFRQADAVRKQIFGNKIYIRGLIEFTNYCKNDCYYCGIRKSCTNAERYRLTPEEILSCCEKGYELGFRTFVLQGGEDPYWTDEKLIPILGAVKEKYPDCAVTLSIGERSRASYKKLFRAGADRYLLRHETADEDHYESLHPEEMDFRSRRECLRNLKSIGYQTGCGFMVGTPEQTVRHLIEDLTFIVEFMPHMVGIGPFIPAAGTPFENEPKGSSVLTLRLLAILRLLIPHLLLPATTALGTASQDGRLLGIKAGANVIMPNLTPAAFRSKYTLYNGKSELAAEHAEELEALKESVRSIGFEIVTARGDSPLFE